MLKTQYLGILLLPPDSCFMSGLDIRMSTWINVFRFASCFCNQIVQIKKIIYHYNLNDPINGALYIQYGSTLQTVTTTRLKT